MDPVGIDVAYVSDGVAELRLPPATVELTVDDLDDAAARALTTGVRRVQATAAPDDLPRLRTLTRAGFRREGVLRGAGPHGEDLVLAARLAEDPERRSLPGWTALMDAALPRTRLIAHVVVTDARGRVLLCRTGFKHDLELPGGIVERGETPVAAARREVREELGADWPCGRLLAVDWLPPWQGWSDAVELLFHAGVPTPELDDLQPDGREIVGVDWYDPAALDGLVSPLNARRLPAVVAALDQVHVLADGRPVG